MAALVAGASAWLILTDAEAYRFVLRFYGDPALLRETLHRWGALAPVIFIVIEALQVVASPIPGDATGFLGGFLFGQWPGFVYSTLGLTTGSLAAFGVGRKLGAPFVRRVLNRRAWKRLGFIVRAGGTILCFVVFLLPGAPKDLACYVFGMSQMRFWVFAFVSTLARMPGTWVLSAQGAKTAEGKYGQLLALSLIAAAVAVPLYYYRRRIVSALLRRSRPPGAGERGSGSAWERTGGGRNGERP